MSTNNVVTFKDKNQHKESCGACRKPMTEKRYRANGKIIICQYCYNSAKAGHEALAEEARKGLDELAELYKAGKIDPAMHERTRKLLNDNGHLVK